MCDYGSLCASTQIAQPMTILIGGIQIQELFQT